MKKPTCTLYDRRAYFRMAPAIQCARRFFHSYLKETKKINNQFLIETEINTFVHNVSFLEPCRPSSDAAERSVGSRAILFAK